MRRHLTYVQDLYRALSNIVRVLAMRGLHASTHSSGVVWLQLCIVDECYATTHASTASLVRGTHHDEALFSHKAIRSNLTLAISGRRCACHTDAQTIEGGDVIDEEMTRVESGME